LPSSSAKLFSALAHQRRRVAAQPGGRHRHLPTDSGKEVGSSVTVITSEEMQRKQERMLPEALQKPERRGKRVGRAVQLYFDGAYALTLDTPVTPSDLVPVGRSVQGDSYDNKTASTRLGADLTDNFDVGLVAR